MDYLLPQAKAPISGFVTIPGSKSASARALVIAALAARPVKLIGILDSRDTQLMAAGIVKLGAKIEKNPDFWEVTPIPRDKNGRLVITQNVTIDVGLSGTVLRFLPVIAAIGKGEISFIGDPEVSNRPNQELLQALESLGAVITNEKIPFTIHSGITHSNDGPATVSIDCTKSSQYLSALLLSGSSYPNGLKINSLGNLPSRPHIDMTINMLQQVGITITQPQHNTWQVAPGIPKCHKFFIEPDLTNAATFLASALVTGGNLGVTWPSKTIQPAKQLLSVLTAFGGKISRQANQLWLAAPKQLNPVTLDLSEISEFTCTATALAAFAPGISKISGVRHIRGHETDRLKALTSELTKIGVEVLEKPDGLEIKGLSKTSLTWSRSSQRLEHNANPDSAVLGLCSYGDHRMAHFAALVGLKLPVIIDDLGCVSKTMPDFPELWANLVQGRKSPEED